MERVFNQCESLFIKLIHFEVCRSTEDMNFQLKKLMSEGKTKKGQLF